MTLTAERLKEMAMMIEHYGADSGCASDQELIEACELALLARPIFELGFGPAFAKKCKDPNVTECRLWTCQEANECQGLVHIPVTATHETTGEK